MLHVYAAIAEAAGKAISARTKATLAAAKARGVKLGNPRLLRIHPARTDLSGLAPGDPFGWLGRRW